MGIKDNHRFLTPAEAAYRLGITGAELTRLRAAGHGPDWVLINRTVRYSLADIQWWRTHTSTGKAERTAQHQGLTSTESFTRPGSCHGER